MCSQEPPPHTYLSPRAVKSGRRSTLLSPHVQSRAAAAHFHFGKSLGPSWRALGQRLPWRHALERTRVDRLMGAPLVWNGTRDLVLRSQCRVVDSTTPSPPGDASSTPPPLASRDSRPLNFIVPPSSDAWPTNCEGRERLCDLVRAHAIDRAMMTVVSNRNILPMLGDYCSLVAKAGVRNFAVVALDNRTAAFLSERGTPYYVRVGRSPLHPLHSLHAGRPLHGSAAIVTVHSARTVRRLLHTAPISAPLLVPTWTR